MTPNQVRTQFVELGKMADHLQMTGLQVWYGPSAGTTVGDDCFEAARCNPATDEFGLIFTPENLSTIPRDAEIQSRGTRQGVPLVEYSGDSNAVLEFGSLNRPNSVDYRTLGGWMEHNFFTVNRWTFEGTNWQIWNAASAGMESGSNPVSGSATWTGTMVGRTRGAESYDPGVLVTGDSGLTFDFATNEIDVTLTGIRSDANESYPDITWDNVPVRDGVFVSRSGFCCLMDPYRVVFMARITKRSGGCLNAKVCLARLGRRASSKEFSLSSESWRGFFSLSKPSERLSIIIREHIYNQLWCLCHILHQQKNEQRPRLPC